MNFLSAEGTVFWLAAVIVLLIIEGATNNLTTIWFAVGAAGALVASQFNASIPVQIIIFIVVSFVALLVTKPLVRKWRNTPITPTNGDRNIGRTALVLCAVTPQQVGRVRLDGVDWSARLAGSVSLEPNQTCRVVAVDSTTLVVEPCNSPALS